MIEVRRDLYMDEQSGEKNEEFNNIKTLSTQAVHYMDKLYMQKLVALKIFYQDNGLI